MTLCPYCREQQPVDTLPDGFGYQHECYRCAKTFYYRVVDGVPETYNPNKRILPVRWRGAGRRGGQ